MDTNMPTLGEDLTVQQITAQLDDVKRVLTDLVLHPHQLLAVRLDDVQLLVQLLRDVDRELAELEVAELLIHYVKLLQETRDTQAQDTQARDTELHRTQAHGTQAHGTEIHHTQPHGTKAHGLQRHGTQPQSNDVRQTVTRQPAMGK